MTRKSGCTNLGSVHLVDGDDKLPDTKGEGKEGVLASLTVLGNTGLEFTSTSSDDEDGAVGLGGTGDHVLDEVTVTGGVDDLHKQAISRSSRRLRKGVSTHSNHVLGRLELPKRDVDRDTTLTLGLELVQHPR